MSATVDASKKSPCDGSTFPTLIAEIVNALQRAGFVVVRQRGSHIRLQRRTGKSVLKLTVPAHTPVKKTTLAKIIKDAGLTLEDFKNLV